MSRSEPVSEFRRTVAGAAILTGVLAGAAGLARIAFEAKPGSAAALGFAATVCLAGAIGGWIVARWPTVKPALGVAKALAATALRIFLPLAALGWLQTAGRGLREAGADRFLLIFYLTLLATDILLHIIGGRHFRGIGGKNAAN